MKIKNMRDDVVTGVLWLVTITGVLAAGQYDAEIQQMNEMEAVVKRQGVTGLLAFVRANAVESPRIYSRWYVETRVVKRQPDRVPLEEAKRSFGLQFAKALELEAKRVQSITDNTQRKQTTLDLLELGEWIAHGGVGYGNACLQERCMDIATVPLAPLVADLSYPIEEVRGVLGKFPLAKEVYKYLVEVLNQEGGRPVLPSLKHERKEEISEQIHAVWGTQAQRIGKWLEKHPEYDSLPFDEQVIRLQKELPEELVLFCDDEFHGTRTVVTTWDVKWHKRLCGYDSQNLSLLRDLLLFREKVGHFPETPPKWYDPKDRFYQNGMEAAFCEAWKPYEHERQGNEWYNLWSGAVIAYDRIKQGKFVDAERQ